uniref:Putative pre-rRNA-processing protein las1 n=1 Tax=Davidia involucrata TaxID=16924 RepID=A0A5B7AB89_DAVIN
MESVLGFKGTTRDDIVKDKSNGHKLVPWISWDEWNFVRESLFSSSPDSIALALQRISVWRSRGCLPVLIEVSASIIEIQQKDPFFRVDLGDNASDSDEMLAMLYCMAIMRLVNGVVEKTRKRTQVSIAEAADAINIPRMLIDIRHEGSHRDLPSLRLVRLASTKAVDWLKSYYWEPQKKLISFQSDGTSSLRNEIKSRLRELAFYLKIKQATRSSSLLVKEKRVKHCERLCGRNKFLSLMAGKLQSSKSAGFRKQITKTLKNLVRLYSSYSAEVVSVLLEFLLNASDSLDLVELPKDCQVSPRMDHLQSDFDDWKPVIAKLSNKEPELLLTLLKAVLEMIESQEAMKYESGGEHLISEFGAEIHHREKISILFKWLVGNLEGLKPFHREGSEAETEGSSTEVNLRKATLVELLRKCLLVSSPGNNQLTASALVLAHMTGKRSLVEKLNKLPLLCVSNPDIDEDNSSIVSSEIFLNQQEDYICQAAEKLEFVKLRRVKGNVVKTTDGDVGNKSRWVVAKSWNRCPIGMLPRDVSSSGHLPVLDCYDNHKEILKSSESRECWELIQCSGKREADCAVEFLDNSTLKKMRETEGGYEPDDGTEDASLKGVKGQLMIGGVWKKVMEEELLGIALAVRILV